MKGLAILTSLSVCAFATQAAAQSWRPPAPSERCPSKWGAADERGSGNHMKPANVLRAAKLIKSGETFELAHVLGRDMPLNPGRQYDVFTKLGMEKVGTLMTRGVLIDIAGLKGVDVLPIDYEITVADLQQALQKQGVRIEPGDAVLIYTGWSKHWGVDNKLYTSGCPGIGVAAAEWLIKQDPMLLGADNWPVEIAPNPDKSINLPVHNIALTVNGVHLLENLGLEPLARARAYEFAFIMQPLKLQGATGSTVAPTAIR